MKRKASISSARSDQSVSSNRRFILPGVSVRLLRKSRLSSLAVLLSIALVAAWGAQTSAVHATDATHDAIPAAQPEPLTKPDVSMPAPSSGAVVPDPAVSLQVSVDSDDTGSNLTINGASEDIAPNQSVTRTYTSPNGDRTANVSISSTSTTDDGSGGSGTSSNINVMMHSETVANGSTNTGEGGDTTP